jgi:hypothetical protein
MDAFLGIFGWALTLVATIIGVVDHRQALLILLLFVVLASVAGVWTWRGVLRLATELSSDGNSVRWHTPVRQGSFRSADIISVESCNVNVQLSRRNYRRIALADGRCVRIHYVDGFDECLVRRSVVGRSHRETAHR